MKKKIWIVRILIIILFAFLLYYVTLPAINLHNPGFYAYLFMIFICYLITSGISLFDGERVINKVKRLPRNTLIVVSSVTTVIVLIILVNVISSPLFNSKSWASRITIQDDTSFTDDIKEVDFNQVPLLDKDSSQKLGDRVMGQMSELVSQYYVSDLYTQINYNNEIVRVTPIEYNGFIKWLNNKKHGVLGYIKVNSVTGASELVKLNKGMKYMPSSYFFENLYRKLRLTYPTLIFDDPCFEIDNDGNPYWIVPVVSYTAIGLRKDIVGVVILDPVTGESKRYSLEEIPSWVDHVFSADLIIEQMDDWGEYGGGFINSIFGQKNVVNTTEGYNYLVMDDDVYLYTGITSVSSDESNLGFILANLRTKETHYYIAPGAEEYSAMGSAEGLVQEKNYKASFPLLINLNGKPTYLLSLKDNAGLVKMYAFVDVADYQKVVVSDSSLGIDVAVKKYLGEAGSSSSNSEVETKNILIESIETGVIDGNTYYFMTDSDKKYYSSSIKINRDLLPFLKKGDKVVIQYSEGNVREILTIKREGE